MITLVPSVSWSVILLYQIFVYFRIIKPTRCTNFSNLFLEQNSTCFGQFLFPSSGVFHCKLNNGICQKTCKTYTIAVCTVKNSWWHTQELSETCRVLFQKKKEKLVHLSGLIIRIYHDARSPERQIYIPIGLAWSFLTLNPNFCYVIM